jgi:hypothetical protein
MRLCHAVIIKWTDHQVESSIHSQGAKLELFLYIHKEQNFTLRLIHAVKLLNLFQNLLGVLNID